jgi:hypothetical protein
MRILTLTRLAGIAAIGSAVYVHKQRGGDWTMASMRDTLRHLLASAAHKLEDANGLRRPMERAGTITPPPAPRSRLSDDGKPRTAYTDLSGKRNDDTGRH